MQTHPETENPSRIPCLTASGVVDLQTQMQTQTQISTQLQTRSRFKAGTTETEPTVIIPDVHRGSAGFSCV